jgi:hypothetical protein
VIRGRKLRARSARYPRRWLTVVALAAAAVLALALVGLIAYVRGPAKPSGLGKPWQPIVDTLAQPVPAVVLTLMAALLLAWLARRLFLEYLSYRPGRIEVPIFGIGPGVDADPAQLTMTFRQRLAVLRLSAPTPVPGAGTDNDFLDVLGREKLDIRNVAGAVIGLLRAAKPTFAWQVSGLLVEREGALGCGVALQVVQLPNRGSPPVTVWAETHQRAVVRAADFATAAILPRTRLCREPWAAWKHHLLPGELLEAFEQATLLEAERRYDEALDAYYTAAERDPMNLALRLRIGQLQEKLGLYLDALETYEGITLVTGHAPPWWRFRYRGRARSERRRAKLAARYRRIVLLGGNELAEQWMRVASIEDAPTARDERRTELRRRLCRRLVARLKKTDRRHRRRHARWRVDPGIGRPVAGIGRLGDRTPGSLLAERDPGPPPPDESKRHYEQQRDYYQLRELLALEALKDLQRLRRWTSLSVRNHRLALTPDTVRLTRACIEVRLAWIQDQLLRLPWILDQFPSEAPGTMVLEGVAERAPAPKDSRWPPRPARLRRRVRWIEGSRRFSRWHEHYNAACAFALPLRVKSLDRDLAEAYAEHAIDRLSRATTCANSGFVAGRRDWLISEDQDLDGLRAHQRFKEFEAMYFPSDAPTPLRPRHVLELESARYVRDLLVATSQRWEQTWHERGRRSDRQPDVHELIDWWKAELRAWALIRRVCRNHRHWRARLELINEMREASRRYGFDPLAVAFRSYRTEAGGGNIADAREAAEEAETRLGLVVDALPDRGSQQSAHELLANLEAWQSELQNFDVNGHVPRGLRLAELCDGHAALWQRLGEWVSTDALEAENTRQEAFVTQIACFQRALKLRMRAHTNGGQRARRQPRFSTTGGSRPTPSAPASPQR